MAGKKKRKKTERSRSIPLNRETAEALKRHQERFFSKFGRLPGPDDPLFFDPSAEEARPIIGEVVDHHMLEAMHKAGIRPALIYAYQKTGRIVTQDNQKFLTKAQLKEYQTAIDEWHDTHESKCCNMIAVNSRRSTGHIGAREEMKSVDPACSAIGRNQACADPTT